MPVFPLLASPETYRACPTDLAIDQVKQKHWLSVFRRHIDELVEEGLRSLKLDGISEEEARSRLTEMREAFLAQLDTVEANIEEFAPLTILNICEWREEKLRAAGIDDPYRHLKREENEKALRLLPQVIASAPDAVTLVSEVNLKHRLKGVLAGNLFDVGATEVSKQSVAGIDYQATLDGLKPRPWRFDSLDEAATDIASNQYKHILIFVDNAGPDFVLGILPLVHTLLHLPAKPRITLTANTFPSLNDVTYEEMIAFFEQLKQMEADNLMLISWHWMQVNCSWCLVATAIL